MFKILTKVVTNRIELVALIPIPILEIIATACHSLEVIAMSVLPVS
jgi:hypothetical protein